MNFHQVGYVDDYSEEVLRCDKSIFLSIFEHGYLTYYIVHIIPIGVLILHDVMDEIVSQFSLY